MADWIKVAIDFLAFLLSVGALVFAWWRTREASAAKYREQNKQDRAALNESLQIEREERRKADEDERASRRESLEQMRTNTARTHGELKDRMVKVEEQVRHLPTLEHHSDLHRDLTKLEGRLETVVATSNTTQETTRRIEDYLLKQAADAAAATGGNPS
ncbi:hypothetical protein BN1012_Phect2611 [Candidatus Phaeomarinobacter ectocarpi]|uniref:Uncharacterized protein n=1 Tax=Candidatus Phaeomarinibacter ectocarpi TaxID=1458461 RepID=X5MGX6_9HYPH|nr:hypothetical protein [Candidatus Phaeomarinobacter ectocarpi]CDO60824.1 hypothetical protein BN1012_Phect2611 [Candidatus Phaeomarinobacter ectocarpi]